MPAAPQPGVRYVYNYDLDQWEAPGRTSIPVNPPAGAGYGSNPYGDTPYGD